jgi:hypothetical protein
VVFEHGNHHQRIHKAGIEVTLRWNDLVGGGIRERIRSASSKGALDAVKRVILNGHPIMRTLPNGCNARRKDPQTVAPTSVSWHATCSA